jgi:hypothetical protein
VRNLTYHFTVEEALLCIFNHPLSSGFKFALSIRSPLVNRSGISRNIDSLFKPQVRNRIS